MLTFGKTVGRRGIYMTAIEIALLVLGTLFVVISFFIVGERPDEDNDKSNSEPRKLTEEEERQIRDNISTIVEEQSELILSGTDDRLDKISNEKIIAVSEYSDQVLEKINTNHQEVVFLYDMLQKKEEELKATLNALNSSRVEYEKLYEKMAEISALAEKRHDEMIRDGLVGTVRKRSNVSAEAPVKTITAQKSTVVTETPAPAKRVREAQNSEALTKTPARRAPARKPVAREEIETLPKEIALIAGKTQDIEQGAMSKNDKILALHKKKKSVIEISKLLGIGQGEVKLVIDLYGN